MRKLVLFMHTSLDGFVAGPNGEMDWISVDDEIFENVGNETKAADTALYGRVTYQMMESYWPTAGTQPNASKHDIEHSQWYSRVTKVVLSKTMNLNAQKNTIVLAQNIPDKINALKQKPGKDIIIFGSPSASHSLMSESLIDAYWLFINPILLGSGIPLFSNVANKTNLTLASSKVFKSGVIALHYDALK